MPLNLTSTTQPGATSILNRWASQVEGDISDLQTDVQQAEQVAANAQAQTSQPSSSTVPPDPTNINVSQNGYVIDGVLYSELSCTYTAPSPLGGFAEVYLVVSGYQGSATLVKVSEAAYAGGAGGSGEFKVTLQRTGETVTCYFVSANADNLSRPDWENAPHTNVTLNGNASAPNAPINLVATQQDLGVELAWTENTEPNLLGYNVYRNTSNTPGSATKIATVATTLGGAPSYYDKGASVGTTYYYWVTATNTAGMEGAKSAVASNSGSALTIDRVADSNSYARTPTFTNFENMIQNPSGLPGNNGDISVGWQGLVNYDDAAALPTGSPGRAMLKSNVPAGSGQGFTSNAFTFTPGATYLYTFWLRTGSDGGANVPNWWVYGGANNILDIEVGNTDNNWQEFSFSYTCPVTNPPSAYGFLEFATWGGTGSNWIEIWGASVVKVRDLDNEVADGSQYARIVASALSDGRIANFLDGMVSGTSFPGSPTKGAVFYRTDLDRYYLYNGTTWIQVSVATLDELVDGSEYAKMKAAGLANGTLASFASGMQSGTSFPGSPTIGEVFYRTDQKRFYLYDGSGWINVSTADLDELGDGASRFAVANGPGLGALQGVNGSNQATNPSLASGSVSSFASYTISSPVTLTYATWVEVGSVSLTPTDGSVLVFIDGQLNNTAANNTPVDVKLQKNGVDSGSAIIAIVPFQNAGAYISYSFVRPDLSPGTSANTYSVWAILQLNVSNPVYANTLTITAMNVKV